MNGVVFQTSVKMATRYSDQVVRQRVGLDAEHGGDEAALGAGERQPPGERGDDGDDAVGDQRGRADQAAAEDRAVHDEREQHAEHQLDADAEHRQDQRVEDVRHQRLAVSTVT